MTDNDRHELESYRLEMRRIIEALGKAADNETPPHVAVVSIVASLGGLRTDYAKLDQLNGELYEERDRLRLDLRLANERCAETVLIADERDEARRQLEEARRIEPAPQPASVTREEFRDLVQALLSYCQSKDFETFQVRLAYLAARLEAGSAVGGEGTK